MVSGYNHCDIYVDELYSDSISVDITDKFNIDIFKNDKPLKVNIVFKDGNRLICIMNRISPADEPEQIFGCLTGYGEVIFNINITLVTSSSDTVILSITSGGIS